jgi:nucleoside 2-deoxyribosyltransferase
MPIWLVLITIGCGYLIFLYTKIFRQTNTLAEKQADYLTEKIDAIDKTTATFERSFKHQEEDLKRVYARNEQLKQELKEREKIELQNLDEQLSNIKNEPDIDKAELQNLRKEIEETKLNTEQKYKKITEIIDRNKEHNLNKNKEIAKVENVFLSLSISEKIENKTKEIIKVCTANNLKINHLNNEVSLHSEITNHEIMKEGILKSDLIICDVTDRNPNVMYELGFAHGIDKPVILIASNVKDIVVDVSNFKFIIYKNLEDLKLKLDSEIKKVVTEINNNSKRSALKSVRDILLNSGHPLETSLKVLHQLLG